MNVERLLPILLFAGIVVVIAATGHSVAATTAIAAAFIVAVVAIMKRVAALVTAANLIAVLAYGAYLQGSSSPLIVDAILAGIFFVAAMLAHDAAEHVSRTKSLPTSPTGLVSVLLVATAVPVILGAARPGVDGSINGGWLAGSAVLGILVFIALLVRAALPRA